MAIVKTRALDLRSCDTVLIMNDEMTVYTSRVTSLGSCILVLVGDEGLQNSVRIECSPYYMVTQKIPD